MRYTELFEKRSHPDLNKKLSMYEWLSKYKDDPHAYLHTTNVMKVGIYPKSSDSHDSPVGIYAYRLMDVWKDYIEYANNSEHFPTPISLLPYHGGYQLFILHSNIDTNFPKNYTEENLQQDIEKLKQIYDIDGDELIKLKRAAKTNLNFVDCPAGYFWGITKAIVAGTYEFDKYTPTNCKRWNTLLRKLGYIGFNDPGYGLIHGAESSQALFLTGTAFKIIDHMNRDMKQTVTKLNGKEYKGGRMPKDLHMAGFDSVFFYNNDKQTFSNIRSWTVDGVNIDNFQSFCRFLPWNAKGIIENLSMGGANNVDYERSNLKHFFNTFKVPKNVHIKNINIGGQYPYKIASLIPDNFPVDKINVFNTDEYGLKDVSEHIKNKIVVVDTYAKYRK